MLKTRKGWIWLAIVLSGLWVLAVCLHAHKCWIDASGGNGWPYISWRNVATGETFDDAQFAEMVWPAYHRSGGDYKVLARFFQAHEKQFAWEILAAVALAPLPALCLLVAGLAWITQRYRKQPTST